MQFSIDKHLALQQSALQLRSQRAQLLASNLANVDTPHYKARDFDFGATLKAAQTQSLQTTHQQHIPISSTSATAVKLAYRVPNQPSMDGNTVEADVEQSRFSENAIQYQTSMKLLSSRITGLMRALRGD